MTPLDYWPFTLVQFTVGNQEIEWIRFLIM